VIGLLSAAVDAVTSFVAGRWLVLVGLVAVLALFAVTYGLGRSHANARWEDRWDARIAAETLEVEAQDSRTKAAEKRSADAIQAAAQRIINDQATIDARNRTLLQLSGRVRDYARRERELSAAAASAGSADAPPGPTIDAGGATDLAVRLVDFTREWAFIRDAEASRLIGWQEANAVKPRESATAE